MHSFETSGTVNEQGQILVAGVPFAPGTEVALTIREVVATDPNDSEANVGEAGTSIREVFTRIRARNTESVGPLRREELYDRKVLR
jgi:hypothetical protein